MVLCMVADGALRLDSTQLLPDKLCCRQVYNLQFWSKTKARDSLSATDLCLLSEDGLGFWGRKKTEIDFSLGNHSIFCPSVAS